MNELSLFSGAGGGLLGSKLLGWKTIGYVEISEDCQKLIAQRIRDGICDNAPIYNDIKTFVDSGSCCLFKGITDIISGGFPCQDISIANNSGKDGIKGIEGERSGLWKEFSRVILSVGPKFVLVENSPMLTSRGLGTVLYDLAIMGYDARWGVLRASQFGLQHVRERIWILAYPYSLRRDSLEEKQENRLSVINIKSPQEFAFRSIDLPFYMDGLVNNPMRGAFRNDDGVADGMVRLKAIGNGQVPLCMARAFQILSQGII